jgi:hypothetical protein
VFPIDLKLQIDTSARLLVDFLTVNAKRCLFKYTFRHSFPSNCCEGASLIFLYLIKEKYGITNAYLQMGENRRSGARHFWVVVGDIYSYDLTAHQFGDLGIVEPIIGVLEHPLWTDNFSQWTDYRDSDHLKRESVLNAYRKGKIRF